MNEQEQLAWGSHMPALLACIGCTTGPVLEIGIGHFSTPHLRALCGAMQRPLVSIEKDAEWHRQIQERFPSSSAHSIVKIADYDAYVGSLNGQRWGVAFIDNSPGGVGRSVLFQMLLATSEYVVVHDMQEEGDNWEHISPKLKLLHGPEKRPVKYHVTKSFFPPTMVASLTREVPQSILGM